MRTGKAGLSGRGGTRAADGVVAARAARAGAARTPRRVCCLLVREGVGVGKGGAGSRREWTAGRGRVGARRLRKASLTMGAVNRSAAARCEPTGSTPHASSPGLCDRATPGGGAGAGSSRRGLSSEPGSPWVAGPGAEMGGFWARGRTEAAPGLSRKV